MSKIRVFAVGCCCAIGLGLVYVGNGCSHRSESIGTTDVSGFTISPFGGPVAGGNALTINGIGIIPDTTVLVGGNPCPVTSVGDSTLTCTVPAGTPSWAPVNLTIPVQGSSILPMTYAYGANVIGQTSFTAGALSITSAMAEPQAILEVGTNLFISDGENSRVLTYSAIPTASGTTPSGVLGQSDLTHDSIPYTSGSAAALVMGNPQGLCDDGTNFMISDSSRHRILIYNAMPTSPTTAPNFVLGQQDFSGQLPNQGNTLIDGTMLNSPQGIYCNSTYIAVADTGNHRVLIWLQPITANDQPANYVLGQTDLTGNQANAGGSVSASSLKGPRGVYYDGTNFFVADSGNQRVLVWPSTFPTTNNLAASVALGPSSLTSSDGRGCVSGGLTTPVGITSVTGYLYVSDAALNRVMAWTSGSFSTEQAEALVLGQSTDTSCQANQGSTTPVMNAYRQPTGLFSDGTALWVADTLNNRVLTYNAAPVSGATNPLADFVQGQSSSAGVNPDYSALNPATFKAPHNAQILGNSLYVSDPQLNRVLVFTPPPTGPGASASLVLGQPNMTSGVPNLISAVLSAATLSAPKGVTMDAAQNLYVSDSGNNRVLMYSSPISASDPSASLVIGNSSFTSSSVALGAGSLRGANQICIANGQLFIPDSSSNRVLVYDSWTPTAGNGQTATYVIGQANFSSSAAATTATGMSDPTAVACNSQYLVVTDQGNQRVLIYSLPISASTPSASLVLGQNDFVSNSVNMGGGNIPSASSVFNPRGVALDGTNLYISDESNNRILAWHSFPTSNGQAADTVFGQSSANQYFPNGGNSTPAYNTVFNPAGLSISSGLILIADPGNARVLILPEF